MLLHLESGTCSSGFNIRHINDMTHTSTGAENIIIQDKFDWFMAGAPRPFASESDYNSTSEQWQCPICPEGFSKQSGLTRHLARRTCSEGYPKVLSCPECPQTFTKLSSLLQHVESLRCAASYDEEVLAELLDHLERNLDMFTPEMLNGRDIYELKRYDPDEELTVAIIDAVESSSDDDWFGY
ncbi:hypothetical protein MMC07_009617 [Pseudocyphellaria aurata]|nr:hypothetical protein [Pseudocyphellaria aurata]